MTVSLYLHIPFCLSKCHYCDFYSVAWGKAVLPQAGYARALEEEWHQRRESLSPSALAEIPTVFFGGGTPSLLDPEAVGGILQMFPQLGAEAEITLEINPKTAGPAKLEGFKKIGVNRVSLGIQSLDDGILEKLGRAHSAREALDSLEWALGAGFQGVNLDIMYGLPYQSLKTLQETLGGLSAYPLKHLSAYELILEEGTPFFDTYHYDRKPLPEMEQILEMRQAIEDFAGQMDLTAYEISNWAQPGFHCRHNSRYWDYESFLGLGAGAVSFLRWDQLGENLHALYSGDSDQTPYGLRWSNVRNWQQYQKNPGTLESASLEWIDRPTAMAEFMMMGLRKSGGIFFRDFENKFASPMPDFYREVLEGAARKGWAHLAPDGVGLSREGWNFSNSLLQEFFPTIDRNL